MTQKLNSTKPKAAPDTRPQRQRFMEAARKSGADESGEAFERALKKIISPKRPSPAPNGESSS